MSSFEKLIQYTSAHRLTTHFFFWMCIYFMFINKNNFYGDTESIQKDLISTAFYEVFSIVGAYFLSYQILPRLMSSQKHIAVWIELVLGIYLISVMSRITVIYVLEPIIRAPAFEQESLSEILTDLPKLFESYFIHTFSLSIFFVFIKLIKDQYLIHKRAMLLEKQKAETELRVLKAQLNPHFLFNTLNNIYSLSVTNSPITSKSIAVLSEILDCILYRCSSTYVPISQEIQLLNNYISLEKLRYDENLSVHFTTSIDHNEIIAPLILLSLVENAFKHGAGEDTGSSPIIDINLKLVNRHFTFTVTNTINDMEIAPESGKIGLNNVIQQLDKIYEGRYTFRVTKTETHFTAHLEIELNTDNLTYS